MTPSCKKLIDNILWSYSPQNKEGKCKDEIHRWTVKRTRENRHNENEYITHERRNWLTVNTVI